MASGFIILSNGACYAPHWPVYDEVIRIIANSIEDTKLQDWLFNLIPKQGDTEILGDGSWLRASDNSIIERTLDIRNLTKVNQALFEDTLLELKTSNEDKVYTKQLKEMIQRDRNGEDPLSISQWTCILEKTNEKEGPGWDA